MGNGENTLAGVIVRRDAFIVLFAIYLFSRPANAKAEVYQKSNSLGAVISHSLLVRAFVFGTIVCENGYLSMNSRFVHIDMEMCQFVAHLRLAVASFCRKVRAVVF